MIRSIFHTSTPERIGILGKFIKPAPTAVLVHGLSSGSRTWDDAVIMLMNQGYNVLTLDLNGHGDSSHLEKYTIEGWINNVVDALEQHKITKIDLLMGHSLGGLISVGVATRVQVDKVILIDPLIAPVHPIMAAMIKQNLTAGYQKSLKIKLKFQPYRDQKTLITDVEHSLKWDSKTIDGITKEEGMRIIDAYSALTAKPPMLIVKPVKSALIPKKDLESLLHWNAEIVELENVGHGVHLDNFSEFSNTIQPFIEKSFR